MQSLRWGVKSGECVNSQDLRNFPSGSLGGRVGSPLGVFICLSLG